MRLLFGSVFAFSIAAAIGLGMTWIALTRGTAYGGVTIGAWTAWPKNGTPGIDPYARAMVARTADVPRPPSIRISVPATASHSTRAAMTPATCSTAAATWW